MNMAISRNILICIKCGSDKVSKEECDIVCENCGAVLFFANMEHLVE